MIKHELKFVPNQIIVKINSLNFGDLVMRAAYSLNDPVNARNQHDANFRNGNLLSFTHLWMDTS